MHRATLIRGDGIGPEVTEAALQVLEAAGVAMEWDTVEAGAEVVQKYGTPVPEGVLDSIRRTRVALKGPIGTPVGGGFRSANVTLRQSLGLFASVRPVKNLPGLKTPFDGVDLVLVRENTEGLYSGLEHQVAPGIVESLKIVTEAASLRIAEYAFQLAQREGRSEVCTVHKANILKLSDGLFLECARRVAKGYPEITHREIIVDNCAMQLVTNPGQFQVLLLENLYGDILSDLCAGLVGGLGVVPGANIGEDIAVFEAVHGSAPDIAGKHLANPTAVILSAVMMLRHLGEDDAASAIEQAVFQTLAEPANHPGDLGGHAGTDEITRAVIERLE
ncbi:MAG: isocitrate/isopropylmalate dehydrogenase family protein [Deltaproteobacteria bacterium]|nr:isocitrate/isopropylmalate dehydrogenase family protein [Deltaproteobacteria bacterium]MBW2395789.1 isocitrate/isopropylmalate dehydrogenase family protein [Deltaproteobacteria bacterium]